MRSILKYIDEALFSSASEFSKADNIDELEFIDLGLSVNWSKCNLGALEEYDSGHYYMWGSTKPNDNDKCCWENTPFNNGKSIFNKEYFDSIKDKVCPDGILAPEYDVVFQESNGDYRMPTYEEFDELINNTKHECIENYNNTNVNGIKFTNKSDDKKFIFIPIAGGRWGSLTRNDIDSAGIIWTASLDIKHQAYAWLFLFTNYNIRTYDYYLRRFIGFPIRPVQDK